MNQLSFVREKGYLQAPAILQIEVTTACPLHCAQCYKPDAKYSRHFEFDLLREIIRMQKKRGLKNVMINGGEPLVYPWIRQFIEELEYNDINSSCFISGYNLEKYIDFFKGCKRVFLNVSLNGSTEEINRRSRDGYFYAMRAIQLLCENNIKFGINWVARKDNLFDFPQIMKMGEAYHP